MYTASVSEGWKLFDPYIDIYTVDVFVQASHKSHFTVHVEKQ